MGLPKSQPIVIRPAGADQRTDETQLPIGKMRTMRNVRIVKPGEYGKRFGFAKIDTDADVGGAISDGRSGVSTGAGIAVRTKSAIWQRSDAVGKWIRQAVSPNVTTRFPPQVMIYGFQPSSIRIGNLDYYFCADHGRSTGSRYDFNIGDGTADPTTGFETWWYYRVVDAVTKAEIVRITALDTVAAHLTHSCYARPVVAGGFVFLFVGAKDGRYVYAVKFDPQNPTAAPTITTFYDAGAAGTIRGWDIMSSPESGCVFAAIGVDLARASGGGGTSPGVAARLDPTTGLPDATGTVGLAIQTPAARCCLQFFKNAIATSSLYFLIVGSTLTQAVVEINANALTLTSSTNLTGYTAADVAGGYRDATTGNYVTFTSQPLNTPKTAKIVKHVHASNGATAAGNGIEKLGLIVASEPFQVNGAWYIIAQRDDDGANLQRGYYLLDESLTIVGRTLHGEAGDYGQRAAFALEAGSTMMFLAQAPQVEDGTARIVLNAWTGQQYVSRELTFVFDDVTPMIALDEGAELYIPSAWPYRIVGAAAAEFIPLYPDTAPTLAAVATGTGSGLPAGTYKAYYTWAYRDDNDNVHESAPSPAGEITIAAPNTSIIRWTVKTLTITNQGQALSGTGGTVGGWSIRCYLTTAGKTTPFLQFTIANETDVTSLTVDDWRYVVNEGERLYSHDGAHAVNDPPPSFRYAATWNRRAFLFDLDRPGFWVSHEREAGKPYLFTEDLIIELPGGSLRTYCGGAVGPDHFAIFEADGVWLITGPGPDRLGNELYEPRRLPYQSGCTNPASLCVTDKGLIYQDSADNELYMLFPNGARVNITPGIYDYRGRPIRGAAFDPAHNRAVFGVGADMETLEDEADVTIGAADLRFGLYPRAKLNAADTSELLLNFATMILDCDRIPGQQIKFRLTGLNVSPTLAARQTVRVRYGTDTNWANGTIALSSIPSTTSELFDASSGWITKPSGKLLIFVTGQKAANTGAANDAWIDGGTVEVQSR